MNNRILIFFLFAISLKSFADPANDPEIDDIPAQSAQRALTQIPGPFDCKLITWVEGCKELNILAKQNPAAPIKIISKDGLEFNFPPGTPSSVISHYLNPSPETARKLADDIEAHLIVANIAAKYWNEEIKRRGGLVPGGLVTPYNNDPSLQSPALKAYGATHGIDYKKVKLYVFIRNSCRECSNFLLILKQLKENHPDLPVRVIHMDGSLQLTKALSQKYNLDIFPVSDEKRSSFEETLDGEKLSIWIQDSESIQNRMINHMVDYVELERILQKVSL